MPAGLRHAQRWLLINRDSAHNPIGGTERAARSRSYLYEIRIALPKTLVFETGVWMLANVGSNGLSGHRFAGFWYINYQPPAA
jgi:hypothetical protein